MSKKEFLKKLRIRLSGIPKEEVYERLNFYSEMIDDRIEEGLGEAEAIAAIGNIDDIVAQICGEGNYSPQHKYGGFAKRRNLSWWEIILIILGSPVWLPLLLAAFVIFLSVYIVIWSVVISLWAVEIPFLLFEYISKGLFVVCKYLTKYVSLFTKYGFSKLFSLFERRK